MSSMQKEGVIGPNGRTVEENISAIGGYTDWKSLNISEESGAHIVDGYFVVDAKWPGYVVKDVMNLSSEATATFIAQSARGSENTITISELSRTGLLPAITKIKVSGTSDNLLLFCQEDNSVRFV
jgi:hypothetical protein